MKVYNIGIPEIVSPQGATIQVYDKDFLGGTRSIIPDKNILIDYSFKTKLMEEQEKFAITLWEAANWKKQVLYMALTGLSFILKEKQTLKWAKWFTLVLKD